MMTDQVETQVEPDADQAVGDDSGKDGKSQLEAALADWDEHRRTAEPEQSVPLEEHDAKVRELAERLEALEGENAGLLERAEKSEATADYIEQFAEHADQVDLARAVERVTGETSLTAKAAERVLKAALIEDENFLAAADNRHVDPETFNGLFDAVLGELALEYPKNNDRALIHATRIARSAAKFATPADENKYGDLSKLSDAEFAATSRQIFEDMKSGRLRASRKRGGFITTAPD